jgi:hypothetical protein
VLAVVRAALGGSIDLDPCAADDSVQWVASRNFTAADDGLAQAWCGRVYMNPPYSALRTWCAKLAAEFAARNATAAVALIAARTDTAAWHTLIAHAAAVCFLRGRLRFVGAASGAPFPSALVYLGSDPRAFVETTAPLGDVWERR